MSGLLKRILGALLWMGLACSKTPVEEPAEPLQAPPAQPGEELPAPSSDAGQRLPPPGLSLFRRLAGLWSGPVTMTRLGAFPVVNMDFRPGSDHVLFGRVDLDAQNALRFAFSIETIAGKDTVVFRNGGLFRGVARDSRTVLVSADEQTGSFRFCAVDGGCDYIDAVFQLFPED